MTDIFEVASGSVEIIEVESGSVEIVEIAVQGPPGATGPAGPAGPAGTTDHGGLTGLSDDDHALYHTDARGDARYAALSHAHAASAITSGTIDTARLGSGTANSSTYLRGDQTWAAAAGGVASDTHAATEKTTPVDSDEVPLIDSAAAWVLKRLTLANLKATLSGVFAVLAGKSGGQKIVGGTGGTDKLVLQGTSGNGTGTATAIEVNVGDNGNLTALSVENCGRVTINANSENQISAICKIKNVYSALYIPLLEMLAPNIGIGQETYIGIGKVATNYNRAALTYYYAGNASADNYMQIGSFYSNDTAGIRSYADGRLLAQYRLDIRKTTEQLRIGYDSSNYAAFTVGSTGNLTLDAIGGTIYTPDTIENTVNGAGIILKSPNGTRYRLTVANDGTLSISVA